MSRNKRYDNYQPEFVFYEAYEKQQELLEEYELLSRKLRHGYKAVTTQAGEMLEVKISPWFKERQDYSRAARHSPTSEQQRKLNNQNAQAKFIRQFNSNFVEGDPFFHGGWTFEQMPESMAEARYEFRKFVERVRTHVAKETSGRLKYMYVIEVVAGNVEKGEPENKYHVHSIFGVDGHKIDMDILLDRWQGGEYPRVGRLMLKEGVGFTGMSTYFSKKMHEESMEETEEPYTRRWGHSQGLKDCTRKPSTNYSKFSRKKVVDMSTMPATLKEEFEKAYPGYVYNENYPCRPQYNKVVGGFYLHCRMYRKRE